ncbi:MAG: peptide chain release factor N(5)-glutamine methyltransferase [Bacilli bacterium]|nr:peptide chain release factor N(5)-glutamine methyltransferase [Bacilli bacterium]
MKVSEFAHNYKRYFNQNTFNFIMKAVYDIDNYYLSENKEIDETKITDILDRFLNGEPIEYLINKAYFFHRYFYVNNNCLLPEDETEELVLEVIKNVKNQNLIGVDIGTGSGCIAITLKKEINANIMASDISKDALEVFEINKKDLDIPYFLGDALKPLIDNNIKVDYIVSNPPYIDYNDKDISESVKKYYPSIALFAKNNGLEIYERILKDALKVLNKKGMIFFEIGYKQASLIKDLANKYLKDFDLTVKKDINNHDRIVVIKLR